MNINYISDRSVTWWHGLQDSVLYVEQLHLETRFSVRVLTYRKLKILFSTTS